MHIWWPIELTSDQLWYLIWYHLNNRFHRQLVTDCPSNLPSSWWPNFGGSSQIIDDQTWRSAVCCLFAPETSLYFAGQNGSSCIKIKFQAWRSITTHQFILCMVFCGEVKWIDAPVLMCDRTYFWQQMIWTISLISLLWWCLLPLASTRSACPLAQYRKLRSLSANQIVDGRSTNRRSRNWRLKMHGKMKHSWYEMSN